MDIYIVNVESGLYTYSVTFSYNDRNIGVSTPMSVTKYPKDSIYLSKELKDVLEKDGWCEKAIKILIKIHLPTNGKWSNDILKFNRDTGILEKCP